MERISQKYQREIEAQARQRTINTCINNIYKYINSKAWDIFVRKFKQIQIDLPQDLFQCQICQDQITGHYFHPQKKILMCANNLSDKDFQQTATHELIHLFDDARAQLDFENVQHLACTEIRASNLSTECQEQSKWKWYSNKGKSYTECVKYRAGKSVQFAKPHVSQEEIEKTIQQVWDVCYHDYEPFTFDEFSKFFRSGH